MQIGTSGIVVNQSGQLLVIKRDDTRTWGPPGGALDAGELPTDGVMREVEEETGFKVLPVRLVGLDFWTWNGRSFLILSFRCLLRGGEARTSAESLAVGFIDTRPLRVRMLGIQKQRVEQALTHDGGPPAWRTVPIGLRRKIGLFLLTSIFYRLKNLFRRLNGNPYVSPLGWRARVVVIARTSDGGVLWQRSRDGRRLPEAAVADDVAPWDAAAATAGAQLGARVRLTDLSGIYVVDGEQAMVFVFTAQPDGAVGGDSAESTPFQPGSEPSDCYAPHVALVADAVAPRAATVIGPLPTS